MKLTSNSSFTNIVIAEKNINIWKSLHHLVFEELTQKWSRQVDCERSIVFTWELGDSHNCLWTDSEKETLFMSSKEYILIHFMKKDFFARRDHWYSRWCSGPLPFRRMTSCEDRPSDRRWNCWQLPNEQLEIYKHRKIKHYFEQISHFTNSLKN